MGPRQTRVEEEVSKARRGGPRRTIGRANGTSRCDLDTFGVIKIIRHSLSARSVAIAHPVRSAALRASTRAPTMKTFIIAVLLAASFLALAGEISDYHSKNARDKVGDSRKS